MTSPRNNKIPDLDVVKGILIVCIAVGHNTLITNAYPFVNRIAYSFHVFDFLFLPFLFSAISLNRRALADRCARYITPFIIFYTFSAILFLVIEKQEQGISVWLKDYVVGLAIASAPLVDRASGFQLYWFLPTLLTLTILRSFLAQASGLANATVLVGLLVLHVLIGTTSKELKTFVPFGLLIVAYVWPLAMLAGWIANSAIARQQLAWMALAVFISTSVIIVILETYVNLATLTLFTYKQLPLMLLHDANAVAAFVALVGLSRLFALGGLWRALGKYSLEIYLFHSLIYQAIFRLYQTVFAHHMISDQPLLAGLALLVITCSFSYVAADIGRRLPGWRLAFPRSLDDWRRPRRLVD